MISRSCWDRSLSSQIPSAAWPQNLELCSVTREDGGTTPDRRSSESSAQQGHKGWNREDIISQPCSCFFRRFQILSLESGAIWTFCFQFLKKHADLLISTIWKLILFRTSIVLLKSLHFVWSQPSASALVSASWNLRGSGPITTKTSAETWPATLNAMKQMQS